MRSQNFPFIALSGFCLLSLPAVLVGCGGSGANTQAQSSATGRVALTLRWPDKSQTRLIPFAANSIRVRLLSPDGARLLGEKLLVRPANGGTSSATFDRLAPGLVNVIATAHPGTDGTGAAQASAQMPATIVAGQTVGTRLTLASTIDRLDVSPPASILTPGQTAQLTATAKNADGEVVLTDSSTLQFEAKNPGVATIEAGGLVHAVAAGTAQFEVREAESGKVGTATVTVQPAKETVVYQNNFEGTVGQEWSRKETAVTPLGARRFLGMFGRDVAKLSLVNLPQHSALIVKCKLYLIRTWDGNLVSPVPGQGYGPDIWSLLVDDKTLLRASFSNWEPGTFSPNMPQSFPANFGVAEFPGRQGASENNTLGYPAASPYPGAYQDAVYTLTYTIPHSASSATVSFSGLETLNGSVPDDEGWGIDDVQVSVVE